MPSARSPRVECGQVLDHRTDLGERPLVEAQADGVVQLGGGRQHLGVRPVAVDDGAALAQHLAGSVGRLDQHGVQHRGAVERHLGLVAGAGDGGVDPVHGQRRERVVLVDLDLAGDRLRRFRRVHAGLVDRQLLHAAANTPERDRPKRPPSPESHESPRPPRLMPRRTPCRGRGGPKTTMPDVTSACYPKVSSAGESGKVADRRPVGPGPQTDLAMPLSDVVVARPCGHVEVGAPAQRPLPRDERGPHGGAHAVASGRRRGPAARGRPRSERPAPRRRPAAGSRQQVVSIAGTVGEPLLVSSDADTHPTQRTLRRSPRPSRRRTPTAASRARPRPVEVARPAMVRTRCARPCVPQGVGGGGRLGRGLALPHPRRRGRGGADASEASSGSTRHRRPPADLHGQAGPGTDQDAVAVGSRCTAPAPAVGGVVITCRRAAGVVTVHTSHHARTRTGWAPAGSAPRR